MSSVQDAIIQTLSEKGPMSIEQLGEYVYPEKEGTKRIYCSRKGKLNVKLNTLVKYGMVRKVGKAEKGNKGGNPPDLWDIVRDE